MSRDHKSLLSTLYAGARQQCGVTRLPRSSGLQPAALGRAEQAEVHAGSCHAHTPRGSHSPVKVLNQWEKEVPSNRTELIRAGSQFPLRRTLSKRKMKTRHKTHHLNLALHWTLSRPQVPCSNPTVSHCLLVCLWLLVSRLEGSLPTSDPLTHPNISAQNSSVLLG